MESKNYKISNETSRYLDLLDEFETFSNDFYNVLTQEYGAEDGDRIFREKHAPLLEDVERVIMDYLRGCITLHMGTHATDITI